MNILSNIIGKQNRKGEARTTFMRCVAAVCVSMLAICGHAFVNEKYAAQSVLSKGKWVKISVPEGGLYRISASQLAGWGFNDVNRVRVCGYGGNRIDDLLSSANYVDDLPAVPVIRTKSGDIIFYGVGPEVWTASVTGRYVQSSNIYTTAGYYFVTQVDGEDEILIEPEITATGNNGSESVINAYTDSFWDRLHYEKEMYSPGQAGPHLVGEDFRITPTREFTFNMKDRIDDDKTGVWFECSFVAKTYNQASTLKFTANDKSVDYVSTDRIAATINDSHYHGTEGVTRHTLTDVEGNTLKLKINHSATVTVQGAWLNYISLNYQRKLRLDANGQLRFWSSTTALSLGNAKESTRVLDVTRAKDNNIYEVSVSALTSDNRKQWVSSYTGMRTYVAFNEDAKLSSPVFEGYVSNQNLHGLANEAVPDMVVLCNSSMRSQAERFVALHGPGSAYPLDVQIVNLDQVYNEFSSGMADVSGIRKYFKMLWDKGASDAPEGYKSKFRYAILLGRTSYDARMLTDEVKAFTNYVVPTWMGGTVKQSLNDTDGYGTDDFMALLKDNSGNDKGLDDLCIAIGRIPVRTVTEATNYIDKLEQYMNSAKKTSWKTSTMFLADDGDSGRHMTQAESFIANMGRIEHNPLFINKVYMDAFTREGSSYPLARENMFRLLDEGVVWWSFIGHANDHSLTHNSQLTYNDLNQMLYKNLPVFYGATCDFLRWDQNSISGGEIMLSERYGGAITVISATRPVYIYENGLLSNAFGRHLGARDADGRLLTVGEIYRRAKNNILTDAGAHLSNTNRLKFVLMGDPAMPLATPSNRIEITEINGKKLDDFDENPVELSALQSAVVKGRVLTPEGELKSDFNGVATVTLYDSEYSTTTNGYPDNDTEGAVITFEQQGPRLSAVSTAVNNGEFEAKITVPYDITDNYRPAAILSYAYSNTDNTEASGLSNKLYVYGFDDNADPDVNGPVIEKMYLNHESFTSGSVTDPSPMLIAKVSDDVSINLSTAGVGHTMTVQVDGNKTYNDVTLYFTPSADGTASGTINYPLSNLAPGEHSLVLRVWDASANSATASIDFIVADGVAPKIYDIYTDANPAHDKANFYISHDRPDQMATVTIDVYNLLGRPVWSKTVTGVSDMFTSTPVTWDLCDFGGTRVQRGIYLYRASITVDGQSYDTGSRRIAVAAY